MGGRPDQTPIMIKVARGGILITVLGASASAQLSTFQTSGQSNRFESSTVKSPFKAEEESISDKYLVKNM